jgi:biotin transport system substrate-specific component
MERIITTWDRVWRRYYEIFDSLTAVKKIVLSIAFSLATGVSAQLYIKLPFTPVPVTGQVFLVLLAGILLGKNTGAISQLLYAAGGIAGINWFYGAGMGFRHTTGYIIGFIFAAYLIGIMTEKVRSKAQMIFAMLCGIGTILLTGTLWLTFFLRVSFYKALLIGFLPFVPFDIVKAYFAGVIAQSIIKNRG